MLRIMLLCLVTLGCASAFTLDGDPGVLPAGFTTCSGDEHVAYIRTDVARGPHAAIVIAHEDKHLEQMRTIGDCDAWNRWLKVPENRANAEAAAFCVSSIVARRMGVFETMDAAVGAHARQLAGYRQLNLTVDSATSLIRKFCG
jgi:hypothetical protein